MPSLSVKNVASLSRQARLSLLLILGCGIVGLAFPSWLRAGVLVTDGSQYVEISGIYYYNFYLSKNQPYHNLLQSSLTDTQTGSLSNQSFDSYAQLTSAASEAQTVTPNSMDATSLILNTHATGTSQALAADYAQSYNYGRDYLLFTLDAPHAFSLTMSLSAVSSRTGPGNSTAASEAYLQLVGDSGYVDYLYVESDDGGAPDSSSHTLEGILDAGSYKLWNYSFASGYGTTGSSSSQDASGSVTLSFPTGPEAIPEPAGIILLSLGAGGVAIGMWWTRSATTKRRFSLRHYRTHA
jgi:hypothetical protein